MSSGSIGTPVRTPTCITTHTTNTRSLLLSDMGRLACAARCHTLDQFRVGSDLRESEQAGRSARVEKREQADGLFLRIRRDATNYRHRYGWRYKPERHEDD